MKNKAIFLDRDGTLIKDVGYLSKIEQIILIPEMIKALKLLQPKYDLFVITNQSGVARGYFDESFVQKTHLILQNLLRREGINIKAFYYCPHHPEYGSIDCNCRKPNPGMILKAADDFNIDLASSVIIGDKDIDVLTGINAGCKGFLVKDFLDNIIEKLVEKD